jgi:hypothetical protein
MYELHIHTIGFELIGIITKVFVRVVLVIKAITWIVTVSRSAVSKLTIYIFSINFAAKLRNKRRFDFSIVDSLPVDSLKERMILDIL